MEGVTDMDMWAALVGFGMPPVVAVVVQSRWKSWQRALAALSVCVAAGTVTAYLAGTLTGLTPVRAVLVVAFTAMGTYRMWWQPSGIAPAIEQATNRYRRPPARPRPAVR